jgi:hypothetical protein
VEELKAERITTGQKVTEIIFATGQNYSTGEGKTCKG